MYVDGFVLPVPKARLDDYLALARLCAPIWREHGALSYHECVADDVQSGVHTSFPQSVQLKDDELVIFAWVTYPDRATRDACNAKVMADPRLAGMDKDNMPFDPKRMFWGGFEERVQA